MMTFNKKEYQKKYWKKLWEDEKDKERVRNHLKYLKRKDMFKNLQMLKCLALVNLNSHSKEVIQK